MADYYAAEIRIWPWPQDHSEVQALAERIADRYGEIQREDGSEMCGMPRVSQQGELALEVEQARYGVHEFIESGGEREPALLNLIQDAGLSFVARDEGKYENEGCEVSWRPGLRHPRIRSILPGGAVALSHRALGGLLGEASGILVEERLRNYFAPLEDYREPDARGARVGQAVVCESDAGAPEVLYASEGVEVLVIPSYTDEGWDVYDPGDVLQTVAEIEGLDGFATSETLQKLAKDLRETASEYRREAVACELRLACGAAAESQTARGDATEGC